VQPTANGKGVGGANPVVGTAKVLIYLIPAIGPRNLQNPPRHNYRKKTLQLHFVCDPIDNPTEAPSRAEVEKYLPT
jgi:hypothetical protein